MPAEDYPALYTRSDLFEFKEETFLVNARRQAQERGYGDFPIFEGPIEHDSPIHVEAQKNLYAMDMLGVDYAVMFPTPLLYMGLHPDPEVEAELTMAYTEWLLENVVPQSPRLKVLAYLPFSSAEHSLRAIRKFGEHPAVAGFMVTTPRFVGAHRNEYAPVYAELQERDLTLASTRRITGASRG